MERSAPILVRAYKQEGELEIWKQTKGGSYALLKTYPICRWSGWLGPKLVEGDRQAPEGFYTVEASALNPNSRWFRSFNLGYPNAYDRSWNRTGDSVMVHGNCRSAGCYAMTDALMEEIYGLSREALKAGQSSFQVQALPFRMTDARMAREKNSRRRRTNSSWYSNASR